MVRFAGPHHFENGDAVVYRTSGSTILPGVADGTVLYVRVIDANTIELYTTAAAATAAAIALTGPGAAPIAANQITDSTLADGARVTYQSAPPLPFTNVGVNVTVDGTGKVTGTNPTAYNIFLGTITVPGVNPTIVGHGLQEGQQVIYQTLGANPITGLTTNGTYFVHLDSTWTVQLAATYCDAVGSDFDPTCEGTDGNGDPVPHPRNLIHIAPPDSCTVTPLPASCSATSAIRPDEIGGLTNGQTYTVNRVDPTHITLQAGGSRPGARPDAPWRATTSGSSSSSRPVWRSRPAATRSSSTCSSRAASATASCSRRTGRHCARPHRRPATASPPRPLVAVAAAASACASPRPAPPSRRRRSPRSPALRWSAAT